MSLRRGYKFTSLLLCISIVCTTGCATTVRGAKNQENYTKKIKPNSDKVSIYKKDGEIESGYIKEINKDKIILINKTIVEYENIDSIKIDNRQKQASDFLESFAPVGFIIIFPLILLGCIFEVNSVQNVCGGS